MPRNIVRVRDSDNAIYRLDQTSITGLYPLDELPDRRNETIGVEGIMGKSVGVVARKHQVVVDITVVHDVLQSLLYTERTRISKFSCGSTLAL